MLPNQCVSPAADSIYTGCIQALVLYGLSVSADVTLPIHMEVAEKDAHGQLGVHYKGDYEYISTFCY